MSLLSSPLIQITESLFKQLFVEMSRSTTSATSANHGRAADVGLAELTGLQHEPDVDRTCLHRGGRGVERDILCDAGVVQPGAWSRVKHSGGRSRSDFTTGC